MTMILKNFPVLEKQPLINTIKPVSIYRLQRLGLIFYPHPLWERGSTDGHFLLFLYLHTSNFLFLLGTENAVGGHGSLAVYAILFDILIITLFD